MAEDRPHGSAIFVGAGVRVGVSVGGTVAVTVGDAVGDALEGVMPPGVLQPAKMERNKIKEMSFAL